MYYINAISSISHQDSFENRGFSENLKTLSKDDELIDPDYKKYIDAKLIRRMSKILRMGVGCTHSCLIQSAVETPEAIIVGTGLGCLTDTMKFLNTYITIEGLLPPTSFIQSTHNTIAGQISLSIKNHGYNTTYTQNTLSFEVALEDAMLCLDEGMDNILIGAADEYIPFFQETPFAGLNLTSGATFLILSRKKTSQTIAKVSGTKTIVNPTSIAEEVDVFLEAQKTEIADIDQVYYSTPFDSEKEDTPLQIESIKLKDVAGVYPTNAALGLHIATDKIAEEKVSKALICNNLTKNNLGLTLVEAV